MTGSVTLIHSQPLCDSSVSVCPKVFDSLIQSQILERKYKADNEHLNFQLSGITEQLSLKDNQLAQKDVIIDVGRQESELMKISLDHSNKMLKKERKRANMFKFGMFAVSVTGVISTVYFVFH